MKRISLLILIAFLAINCSNPKQETAAQKDVPPTYARQDLKKISWIEGNWRGTYDGKYFYELYRFTNDSTLEIISYEWDGQDSSKTSRSYLRWIDEAYYLGDQKNYKVAEISDEKIYMLPVKANNDILWKTKDGNSWEAILKASSGKENRYLMERVATFNVE